jgi:tetratricopeptide (TPR) repeat protein
MDGQSVQGYTLLSHIHEDMGNQTEAVNALVMAATNAPRDAVTWIRAGRMSRDLGFWQQAIRCYDTYRNPPIWANGRGYRLGTEDLNVLYERSVIHAEHGSAKKVDPLWYDEVLCQAIEGFTSLLRTYPMDMTITRELAKVYNLNGRKKEAVSLYEQARNHYMSLPQQIKANGDLNTPFDWYGILQR